MMMKSLILLTALAFSTLVFAENIPTRFGKLEIKDNMLLFQGRPVSPEVNGNNSLNVKGTYQLGDISDVVLIQDNGGSGCPAQLYFITLSKAGSKVVGPFGSCIDAIHVKQLSDAISVTMVGFIGAPESDADLAEAAKEKYIYFFKNGVLTENGKRVTKFN